MPLRDSKPHLGGDSVVDASLHKSKLSTSDAGRRTDLHVVDGDLSEPKLPIIPGHEIVGTISALGADVDNFKLGERVGIPWLGRTCGCCSYCLSGAENLCDEPGFTGYQIDGGFADLTLADARFCFPVSDDYSDAELAPLLCAGLIGYRSLLMAGDNSARIGIYGFGAAAHIVTQVARYQDREVYAFTRPGDLVAQQFALDMGAIWAGNSDQTPPQAVRPESRSPYRRSRPGCSPCRRSG